MMEIVILGAGNGGTTIGADLTLKGHSVTLVKTSDSSIHSDHFEYLVKNQGKLYIEENGTKKEVNLFKVTDDLGEAFKTNVDLVIIYVQTIYHKELIKKISPYLKENQIVIVEPGYLAAPYFIENKREDIIVVEAESSPIDCRITNPGEVKVLFRNIRNPIGIYPSSAKEYVLERLAPLKYNFIGLDSIVEAALHNPNIIVHTVGAIMSIPRIEYSEGEYWMYKEVFTPSVWNLVESLDFEKMNILKELGLKERTYLEKCHFRNSLDLTLDEKDVFWDYALNNSPKGPTVSNSRYITEDVSQGLVLMEQLGTIANVKTPTCSSLIDIASAALKIDFRENGRMYDINLYTFITTNSNIK